MFGGAGRRGSRGASILLVVLSACAGDHGDPEPVTPTGPFSWKAQKSLFPRNSRDASEFGQSVAMSGDTLAVGALSMTEGDVSQGSVQVFVRSGQTWAHEASLTAVDGPKSDYFGISVAVSGDTIVVGAPNDEVKGIYSGSAYVFVRSGETWGQQQKLFPDEEGASFADFGRAVAISGDTIVVGARQLDNEKEGAAYVFVRSGETWTKHRDKLIDPHGSKGNQLGWSVAVSGDTALVGSLWDREHSADAGAALVFVRSGETWDLEQKLYAPDGVAKGRFGFSVALSGTTAVVTSLNDYPGAPPASGSAHVFERSGTTWSPVQKLVANDTPFSDYFGKSAALAGDRLVVSAPEDHDDHGAESGSVHVFARSGQTWTREAKLVHPSGPTADGFGVSVAVSGNVITVGVPADDAVGKGAGAAYVFKGRQDDGKPCRDAGDCISGFCADDVCCESACQEAGAACSAEKKGWGADGVCDPIETSYYGCHAAPGAPPVPLVVVALAALAARARRRR